MDNKKISTVYIDISKNKFMLDDVDIGSKAKSIEFSADGENNIVKITLQEQNTVIKGNLVSDEYVHPVFCSCGRKLSDYSFDCTLLCDICGKATTVINGHNLYVNFNPVKMPFE